MVLLQLNSRSLPGAHTPSRDPASVRVGLPTRQPLLAPPADATRRIMSALTPELLSEIARRWSTPASTI